LIYKGRVLLDCKTIEFYKIKNDDTIQLVPFRRRKPGNTSAPRQGNGGIQIESKEPEIPELRDLRGAGEIRYIQFSVSEGPAESGSLLSSFRRNLNRENTATRPIPQSVTPPPRPVERPTPLTVSGTLRSFKLILEETLRRMSEARDNRELVPQISTLISAASVLRDDLVAEQQTSHMPPLEEETEHSRQTEPRPPQQPSSSRSIFEVVLLGTIESSSRRETLHEEEKEAPTSTTVSNKRPDLSTTINEPINIPPETIPSAFRFLPMRFNERVSNAFFALNGLASLALVVSQSYSDNTGHLDEFTNEPALQSSSDELTATEPVLQSTSVNQQAYRPYNIFTQFLNRFY